MCLKAGSSPRGLPAPNLKCEVELTRRPVSLEAAGKLTWHHGAWGLRCDWGAAWGSPKQLASNRPVVERPEDMLTSGHMLLALGKMDLSANFYGLS